MIDKKEKELLSQIRQIMQKIRDATPKPPMADWRYPSDLNLREDFLYGEKVSAASVTLYPTGCQHAARGGCTMCGEWSGSNLGELVPPEFHVAQFAATCGDLSEIQWLRIYQEGSFLNGREVAPEARKVILSLASKLKGVRRLTIESRPEHLTYDNAIAIRSYVKEPVELLIGVGLEAKEDFVRNVCIGKATSLVSYERAVQVAKDNNILTLAYVLLKPPFLSEGEAYREAIKTVIYAFEIGFDEVYVQAASIHEWSLLELLALEGLYSPPWLWSIIEIIKETSHLGPVKIGGLEYFPRPLVVAQNYKDPEFSKPCDCSQKIWNLIKKYNAAGDVSLFTNETCSCYEIWQSVINTPEKGSLSSRALELLKSISVEDYLSHKLENKES